MTPCTKRGPTGRRTDVPTIAEFGYSGYKADVWRPLWKIDQRIVGFAVRRFAGREMEGDWAASGVTETMNFTGEPAPRAAKSSLMGAPFPPAAET